MLINGDRCLGDVRILDVGNKFGTMNTAASFYPMKMSLEKRQASFLEKRKEMAKINDFDYKKFFMASQTLKDGSYCVLTDELISRYDDGWLLDIPEDILIITRNTPGVVVGHPIADCPVIIMNDKKRGVTALGHCSAEMVDSLLPINIFQALEKEFGTTCSDVKVYVSSCISDKWEYDCFPTFAKSREVWYGTISEVSTSGKDSVYNIDIRKAIYRQLLAVGINAKNIYWNMDDTLTDTNYYSNSGARFDPKKKGRNFAGAYYPKTSDGSKVKVLK